MTAIITWILADMLESNKCLPPNQFSWAVLISHLTRLYYLCCVHVAAAIGEKVPVTEEYQCYSFGFIKHFSLFERIFLLFYSRPLFFWATLLPASLSLLLKSAAPRLLGTSPELKATPLGRKAMRLRENLLHHHL